MITEAYLAAALGISERDWNALPDNIRDGVANLARPRLHLVIDLTYGDEGNPGVKAFLSKESADAEEKRLLAEDPKDGTYLVVRDEVEVQP
jgi:hypothetical protein